jgi:hypothetical protein
MVVQGMTVSRDWLAFASITVTVTVIVCCGLTVTVTVTVISLDASNTYIHIPIPHSNGRPGWKWRLTSSTPGVFAWKRNDKEEEEQIKPSAFSK